VYLNRPADDEGLTEVGIKAYVCYTAEWRRNNKTMTDKVTYSKHLLLDVAVRRPLDVRRISAGLLSS